MAVIVFTVIFLFIPLAKQEKTDHSLAAVLNTVKKLTNFYKQEYKHVNIDGLFGLRVIEGHTEAILKRYEAGELQHLSKAIILDVRSIKEQASSICSTALDYVKKDDPKYFQMLEFIVASPWDVFDRRRRKVNFSKEWSAEVYHLAKRKGRLDEEQSDRCMSELIGSHKSGGKPCDISSQCISIMTSPGLLGYGITHQVLWTLLAEKAGCTKQLETKLLESQHGSLEELRSELCSNNYIQLFHTLERLPNKIILPAFQDLYLEQLFVCPSVGFYEFLDIELLPQIISWQHEKGCYGKMEQVSVKDSKGVDLSPVIDTGDYDYADGGRHLGNAVKGINLTEMIGNIGIGSKVRHGGTGRKLHGSDDALWDGTVVKGRKLLVEKSMKDGCLAHKTGVASGALILFLRFLCEPDAASIFNKSHQLNMSSGFPKSLADTHLSQQRKDQITNRGTDTLRDKYTKPFPVGIKKPLLGAIKESKTLNVIQGKNVTLTYPPGKAVKYEQSRINADTAAAFSNKFNKSELASLQDNVIFKNETSKLRLSSFLDSNQNPLNEFKKLEQLGELGGQVDAVRLLNVNKEPDKLAHERIVRENQPLEVNKMVAGDRYGNGIVNNKLEVLQDSQRLVNAERIPQEQAESNQNFENLNVNKSQDAPVQQPVVLDIPDEDIGGDGDDDEDYDDEDEDADDDGEYDEEDADDHHQHPDHQNRLGEYEYEKGANGHLQVQKPNNDDDGNGDDDIDDGDDDDDDYDNGDYDDENEYDADYDNDLKSAKDDGVLKSANAAPSKDVLKGHINARNLGVNRNDFPADHDDYGDNKRYDDQNVKHLKHDRYAYDDYKNDEEDDNEDEYDYDDKNEDAEIKDSNADIQINVVKHSKPKTKPVGALQTNVHISNHTSVSSNSALLVFGIPFVLIVLLTYRFIKKRRLHFRFKPRISLYNV